MICKNNEKRFQRYHVVSQIFNGVYKNKNLCSNDHIKNLGFEMTSQRYRRRPYFFYQG